VTPPVEALYREHGRSLYRYLVRMTGDHDLAEDVLHDTFERLLQSPPRREHNLKGWLFRVATNRLTDEHRRSARRLRLLGRRGPTLLADPPPPPDREVIALEARKTVRALLDRLPPRDRAILLMREEGFTHREIAEAVGTTTKSVGTLIARALDRIMETAFAAEGER
jgi:RNA polymerase sigma-70 factor (ECF subfamily)